MSLYPDIRRCQHLKVNGTQCGSPALTRHKFCFFHQRWREASIKLSAGRPRSTPNFQLPVLEDANSIQVALMQVVAMILSGELEAKRAGLVLYALQTASANLRAADFEPEEHQVVVHPEWVKDTPLGEDQFQESSDFEEVEMEGDEEDAEDAADAEPAEAESSASEPAETQGTASDDLPEAEDAVQDATQAEAAVETRPAAGQELSLPATLAEARAQMKKQVMAAYPEIMAALKDVKACAASPRRRRNGRRMLSSA